MVEDEKYVRDPDNQNGRCRRVFYAEEQLPVAGVVPIRLARMDAKIRHAEAGSESIAVSVEDGLEKIPEPRAPDASIGFKMTHY
jgi:hypothetical protein